jgi:ATP-dependent DNA helicase DinG
MKCATILGDSGPFVDMFPDFTVRTEQLEMASAVESSLKDECHLIVEAGTGTGKTVAYLVPAVCSGLKVVVSTGTRNLQDQLFYKDLPQIKATLDINFKAALLKGRANYLCPDRLHSSIENGLETSKKILNELQIIKAWWSRTNTGDISEITEIHENSPVWPKVTSNVDNCLGQGCSRYSECPVYKARSTADQADIIVVNHHLMFADLVLKEEGIGQVLPDVDAFVVDEAHQVPDIASTFFGMSLSSRQMTDLCRDVQTEMLLLGDDDFRLSGALQGLQLCIQTLTMSMDLGNGSAAWSEVNEIQDVADAISKLDGSVIQLSRLLASVSERSQGLDNCNRRLIKLADMFALLSERVESEEEYVHWVESNRHGFVLHLSPLDVSRQFGELVQELGATWVFTSATLSVAESFGHFVNTLGVPEDTTTIKLNSPYRFDEQVLFYVPEELPLPSDVSYTARLVDHMKPLIEANQGGTFFLFTSHRALTETAEKLSKESNLKCLVQGSMPRSELIRKFKEQDRAVLLGTNSFWEGVDVKGDSLTCVIIDKLPFMSPGDPVVKARLESMTSAGVNGFYHYQLPEAVIALKQGFGRLIRDETDRGMFVLGDPRVFNKSYGKTFIRSLPGMPITRNVEEAEEFLRLL